MNTYYKSIPCLGKQTVGLVPSISRCAWAPGHLSYPKKEKEIYYLGILIVILLLPSFGSLAFPPISDKSLERKLSRAVQLGGLDMVRNAMAFECKGWWGLTNLLDNRSRKTCYMYFLEGLELILVIEKSLDNDGKDNYSRNTCYTTPFIS